MADKHGAKPERRAEPYAKFQDSQRGGASLHIRRQSRCKGLLGQSRHAATPPRRHAATPPRRAVPQKSFVAASPTRRAARLGLAVFVKLQLGLCPWFGLWPMTTGQSPLGLHDAMPISRIASEAEPHCTSGGRADVKDF